MENTFKRRLQQKQSQIGLWLGMGNGYAAEMVAGVGFDWLLIDGEHAPNTLDSVLAQLQALAPYPVHPVVRCAWNDTVEIKRLLDIGATTLLIPMVQNAEEAARAVAATRYPPQGVRGVGAALARASQWNRRPDYLKLANQQMCVLVQVETASAMAEIEAICAVDGVDGVFIGVSDLAADMGYLGHPGHAEVQQEVEAGIRRIVAAGTAAGTLIADEALAQRYIELGTTFTAVGVDTSLLVRAAADLAGRFKERQPSAASASSGPSVY